MIVKKNIPSVCKTSRAVNSLENVACLIGGNVAFPYLDSVFGLRLKVQKHFSRNGSLCNGICVLQYGMSSWCRSADLSPCVAT